MVVVSVRFPKSCFSFHGFELVPLLCGPDSAGDAPAGQSPHRPCPPRQLLACIWGLQFSHLVFLYQFLSFILNIVLLNLSHPSPPTGTCIY